MKNHLLLSLLAFLCINVNAQTIELELSNPLPRVGHSIGIDYSIPAENHPKFSFEEIDGPRQRNCKDKNYLIASGNFRQSQGVEEPGKVTYGPFEFTIGDKVYTSKQLEVEVYPKLPNVQVGVWATFVEVDDRYYLVFEYRMAGKVVSPFPSASNYRTSSKHITIDKDKFDNELVKITSSRRRSNSGSKLEGEMPDEDRLYSVFVSIYELWISEDYKDDFVFTADYLSNLPEGMSVEDIPIVAGK